MSSASPESNSQLKIQECFIFKISSFIFRFLIVSVVLLVSPSTPSFSRTWMVTSTSLEGEGSFDWAIRQAQLFKGADTVQFAIPLSDPGYKEARGIWELRLYTPFAQFTDDSTFIDGASQTRNIGNTNPDGHEFVLTGPFPYPGEVPAFYILSAYNKISGLCIHRFRAEHIFMTGENAHHNVIQNCYIGMDEDGMLGVPNKWNTGIHIREGSHHNLVGGRYPGEGNILGSFWYEAVECVRFTHHNRIIGNLIGVDKTGNGAIGVGWNEYQSTPYVKGKLIDSLYAAIYIRVGSYANEIGGVLPGEGNVICTAGRSGIEIRGRYCDDNMICGNFIGVGADGETVLPNNEFGIAVWLETEAAGPFGTIIGGTQPGAGNIISGNFGDGIRIRGNTQNTVIQGNKIGINAAGTRLIPNGHNGILMEPAIVRGFPNHNFIGPDNVIIASTPDLSTEQFAAVKMFGSGTSYNTITGNYIGCNPSASISTAFNSGVILLDGAHHNTIGPANVIAKNKKYGIYIHSSDAIANTITRNSIYGNSLKAIELAAGANANLPVPVILSAEGGNVRGFSLPNSTVELFTGDPVQARLFLGSVITETNGTFLWAGQLLEGFVTATVTDAAGNTSELASSRPVPVELSYFDVFMEKSRVHLQWTTNSESSNLGFYVERKLSGGRFKEIGFVPGAGTSSKPQTYHFYDVPPEEGQSVFYRLRQQDLDGMPLYSHEIGLELSLPDRFTLSPAWPNPFNNRTSIRFFVPQSARIDLSVYNIRGGQVRTLIRNFFQAGEHQIFWDGRDDLNHIVGSGVYFIRMTSGREKIDLSSKVFYLR
ncbi:T9SS type A sorting domain-containing protein [candidate division KSB1 bacterium]|nr:T9SS type A sorting domain-containing protein [candidate division KSB1 bacterium]